MWTTFTDDDEGFVRWRETHPLGFVVNHAREPQTTYLKLHRATCWTISGALPGRGDNWTTAYGKTCAHNIEDLRRWAARVGGELDRCSTCQPD